MCKHCNGTGLVSVVSPKLLIRVTHCELEDNEPLRFVRLRCSCPRGGRYSRRVPVYGSKSCHIAQQRTEALTWQAVFAWAEWVENCQKATERGRQLPTRPACLPPLQTGSPQLDGKAAAVAD